MKVIVTVVNAYVVDEVTVVVIEQPVVCRIQEMFESLPTVIDDIVFNRRSPLAF